MSKAAVAKAAASHQAALRWIIANPPSAGSRV